MCCKWIQFRGVGEDAEEQRHKTMSLSSCDLYLGMAESHHWFDGRHWLFSVEQPHPGGNFGHIKMMARVWRSKGSQHTVIRILTMVCYSDSKNCSNVWLI